MKSRSLLVSGILILCCFILLKRWQNVAKELPVSDKPVVTPKIRKPVKATIETRKNDETETIESFRDQSFLDNSSIYKKGDEGAKIREEFKKKSYLDIPDFPEFSFSDFSEDDVAILVGTNDVGDKLTFVATRTVISPADVVKSLAEDPSFLKASDPEFDVSLMKPVMNLDKRNGFSGTKIWKSTQNGKDYYMFYAPREDGRGSYGVLLDGDRSRLEENEDYYEQKLLEIKARGAN